MALALDHVAVSTAATMDEWQRRRAAYRYRMKGFNRLALWVSLPSFLATFVTFGDAQKWAGALCLVSITIAAGAAAILGDKYLRCPHCGSVPARRGAAYGATVCGGCHAELTEPIVLPP